MTVSVMLITHQEVGEAMLNAVASTIGELPLPTTIVSIDYKTDPDTLLPRLKQATEQLEDGQGLLILTDLYGSTPCNIATALGDTPRIKVVSGLNLPMLFRVMNLNYADLSVNELAEKAISGGKEGVINCESDKDAE